MCSVLSFLAVVLFCFRIAAASEEISSSNPRIVNGSEVLSISETPHQVSIRAAFSTKWLHFCGGTLISDRWILTAAHCCVPFKADQVVAVVGSLKLTPTSGDWYRIEKIVPHQDYIPEIIRNDIGLMKLKVDLLKNRRYSPIPICSDFTPENVPLRVSGWGENKVSRLPENLIPHVTSYTYPQYLGGASSTMMYMNTTSISNEECLKRFFTSPYPRISIGKNMCTLQESGRGTCRGDSGSGLVDVAKNCVCGVVSWGVPCATGMPDVYARAASYQPWVKNITENM